MPKPANLGAPRPVNTLSNNNASSRTPFGISPSSRSIPSSPPPAKRRRTDEADVTLSHSHAIFAPIQTPTSRKRSLENVSVTDSQLSVTSNLSPSQQTLSEYRIVDRHTKPKRRRSNRGDLRVSGQETIESPGFRRVPCPKSDEDDTEDEVDLLDHRKIAANGQQAKRKRSKERPILDFVTRFQGSGTLPSSDFEKAIDNAERNMSKQKLDLSADELAPSSEEIAASRSTKRQRKFSPSLSRKGKALPSSLQDHSNARSSIRTSTNDQLSIKQKSEADMIIGRGLRILRGACGRSQYEASHEGDPDECFLSVIDFGHTLFPVDSEKNLLESYIYLTLDITATRHILRAKDVQDSRIVSILQRTNPANSAGAKLMIEFASPPDFEKFFQWVAVYMAGSCTVVIRDCNRTKLENDLNEMIIRAGSHQVIKDDTIMAPVPDDIRVIQHNRNSRVAENRIGPSAAAEPNTGPKLRDAMQLSPSRHNDNDIASHQLSIGPRASIRRQPQTVRTILTYAEPPEPEPEPVPVGWTSVNEGWENQWRNSLVYPSTGKNRATIDKDDIQRLDEGQYLNDNIIIFYLRYLQKSLEERDEKLAKRIYFQNTFFYDKLKPTKTGQGINYDSVKTWTSKVDLFSKDYIIVPINEFNHWYVAIICNAPKLIRSSDSQERPGDNKSDVTATPNHIETTQEIPKASEENGVLNGHVDSDYMPSIAREDVVENFRRMSIDSSGLPSSEAKEKTENTGEHGSSVPATPSREVYVIKDSDRPEAEVEHIATTTNPQTSKKTGKRKFDPTQPRIITLDSLGAPHSPTCSYLKQYLIAELRDKRGIEVVSPGSMGTTAKDVPEQTNHCDCGLFLLGYIQQFLLNPDTFIKSLLQRDGQISWHINPSELRNNIRDLIFCLQKEQQKTEDAAQERKRRAKASKLHTKAENLGSNPIPAAGIPSPLEPEMARQSRRGDEAGGINRPLTLPNPQLSSPKGSSTVPEETIDRKILPPLGRDTEYTTTGAQSSSPHIQSDNSKTAREEDTGDQIKRDDIQPGLKPVPREVASPHRIEPVFDHQKYRDGLNTPMSADKNHVTEYHSPSSEMERSTSVQRDLLPSLISETPSSKGSRGATPLDPVVVDDSDNNGRPRLGQSPHKNRGTQPARRLVVEIQPAKVHSGSPGRDGMVKCRKQTEQQSSYFANRREGEKVTAAKLRENPQSDVIDLSDD